MKARILLSFAVLMLISSACSRYQKIVKSTDLDLKFKAAIEYYEDEKYNKAYPLLDELLTLYRGTQKAQQVYYYFAFTNYKLNDYILAAYHFKNFSRTFPNSPDAEECAYMAGYCYFLESPAYSLDQTYTYKAVNELQLFVNTHRQSVRLQECNEHIQELRKRLERKSYERADLYFKTGYYQAAVVAFNNTLNEFPDTQYREELLYSRLQAAYELAANSISSKKLQRFIESQTAYFEFIDAFPSGKDAEKATEMYAKIKRQINYLQQS